MQGARSHLAALGIEEPVQAAAAGAHALGQLFFTGALRLNCFRALPRQHALDHCGLDLVGNTFVLRETR
jgi:hypothetical protein